MFLLISSVFTLSYNCDYETFGEISKTNFLYKEDLVKEVKWLDTIIYCRDKVNPDIYSDSGKGKCEYSRGLCYWENGSCLNTFRGPDSYSDCIELFNNNILVDGLDNGRLPIPDKEENCKAQFIIAF